MDEALGQRPSINPPVVIASLSDEEAGPSCSVPQAEPGPSTTGDAQHEGGGRRRTADPVEDELLDLIQQDMREPTKGGTNKINRICRVFSRFCRKLRRNEDSCFVCMYLFIFVYTHVGHLCLIVLNSKTNSKKLWKLQSECLIFPPCIHLMSTYS